MAREVYAAAHKLRIFWKEMRWCGNIYSEATVTHDPKCVDATAGDSGRANTTSFSCKLDEDGAARVDCGAVASTGHA